MIPDRGADSIHTEVRPVADESALANVIRLGKHGRLWRALIGPDPRSGVHAFGRTRLQARVRLDERCEALGWAWDKTWREPTLSDLLGQL